MSPALVISNNDLILMEKKRDDFLSPPMATSTTIPSAVDSARPNGVLVADRAAAAVSIQHNLRASKAILHAVTIQRNWKVKWMQLISSVN